MAAFEPCIKTKIINADWHCSSFKPPKHKRNFYQISHPQQCRGACAFFLGLSTKGERVGQQRSFLKYLRLFLNIIHWLQINMQSTLEELVDCVKWFNFQC